MKRILPLLFVLVLCASLLPHKAVAEIPPPIQTNECTQNDRPQVSSLVKISSQAPVLYARASLVEQQIPVTLYFQAIDLTGNSPCIKIGSITLSKDWQKVNVTPSSAQNSLGTLLIVFSGNPATIGAGGPQAIFTSETPPCQLGESCLISYGGSAFDLSPKKISSSSDTLRVGLLSDLTIEKIKQVIYSVDGVQAYTKKTLEQFNLRYVPGGSHSIERTIVLGSGQSLTDKKIIKKGTFGDVGYLFTAAISRYSKPLLFVGIIIAGFLFWMMILFIGKLVYRRRIWRETHITGSAVHFDADKAGPQPEGKFEDSIFDTLKNHKKALLIPFFGIAVVFVIFSFVLSVFTVDGISMFPTLKDKSKHPLLIFPAVIGRVLGNDYTPGRGTIVVIQKDDNNLFNDAAVQQKSYVVKRVIALPEERIVIRGGIATVYNKKYPDGFVPDDTFKWFKSVSTADFVHLDITLKQGELFVMGDNRDNSVDSRFYGPIKTTDVVGKVL